MLRRHPAANPFRLAHLGVVLAIALPMVGCGIVHRADAPGDEQRYSLKDTWASPRSVASAHEAPLGPKTATQGERPTVASYAPRPETPIAAGSAARPVANAGVPAARSRPAARDAKSQRAIDVTESPPVPLAKAHMASTATTTVEAARLTDVSVTDPATAKSALRTPVLDAASAEARLCLANPACLTSVAALVQDTTLAWVRVPPSRDAERAGAHFHALSSVKARLACGELEIARNWLARSAERLTTTATLAAQTATPDATAAASAQVARVVGNEVFNETVRRCRPH